MPTLLVIREMQIRTPVRFHFTPTGMAIITTTITTTPETMSVAEYVEKLEHSRIAGRNVK